MKKANAHEDDTAGNADSYKSDFQTETTNRNAVVQPIFATIPIVAIGASAGGLEAIEHFFDAMPTDSGCAFVVIQHLSPDFRSLMHELLARHSTMKIYRIEDGMTIKANSIYLNTPRTDMTITGNVLNVAQTKPDNTVHLPIDLFFQSLAKERGADAVALVLSGTGSDGTKGCRVISNAGGRVLVQDPQTTRFDSMVRSVIAEGAHTIISSPAGLAVKVYSVLKKEPLDECKPHSRIKTVDPLSDILSMLESSHSTDFVQYKDATIHRRIERRAYMKGITELEEYRDFLSTNSTELTELYADLLIEVTEFFRDEDAFEVLRNTVLPEITRKFDELGCMRVWVPGCASGEEAYSLAILLQEQARTSGVPLSLKIMATDIHTRSMEQASSGTYSESAIRNVPAALIDRYFDCAEGQARLKPGIRNMVFFSTHDVTRDPPFTKIDLVSCRNLLIYLKESTQEKVMNLLHYSLRKDGYLFLGSSEHIGKIAHEFDTVNEKWRIFRKKRDIKLHAVEPLISGTGAFPGDSLSVTNRHNGNNAPCIDAQIPFKRAHRNALEAMIAQYAPPGFLLTEDGTIVHVFGNAAALIPIRAGAFSERIIDLIIPELKVAVAAAIEQSQHNGFSQHRRMIYVNTQEATSEKYEISLSILDVPGESTRFLLLCIESSTTPRKQGAIQRVEENTAPGPAVPSIQLQQRIAILESSLQSSEENLQSTVEALETSNEELQSTNEELMSANEEMQSTNEELHSVNEELYTVSAEHQRKNEELTERETDINVLLNSSGIGTVHLDVNLCLRRYTNNALSVFNIKPQDIGRSINHITIVTTEQDILGLIYSTSRDGETHEIQVSVDNKTHLLRIIPYESVDHSHNGVMITVIDISDIEYIRSQLAELDLQYRDILECTDSFFVKWDAKTNAILFCNEPYAKRWGTSSENLIGQNILSIRSEEDQQTFRELVGSIAPNETKAGVFSVTYADGNLSHSNVFTRSISNDGINIDAYQTNGFDCTDEYNYRAIVENLFSVVANDTLDFNERLSQILQIGLDYYTLDTAIISMILGKTYEVTCVIGENPQNLAVGSKLNLQDTICSVFVESEMSLAINDLSNSELGNLQCHRNTSIESFVGAAVNTACGPYGTVNFSSLVPRSRAYSEQDKNLCMLIGSWVSFLVGNLEQLEFMGNQNEYYSSLFLTVPTMIFLCDEDGLIISCSNRLCENLGLDITEVPGKNCVKYFDVDNRDALKAAVKTGSASRLPLVFNVPNKPVLEAELDCTIKPIGTIQGVRMAVLVDVSERNAVLRKAENQNKLLISANENLNQFAFIASHDLQEPLRKIQQFSNFLEEDLDGKLVGDAKYHLDVIVDASERMSTLIYDLLRYSGASQEEPEAELISLNELLSEVQVELELSIAESDATITIGDLPEVTGDKGLLRQLFVNLVSNSIKYRAKNRALEISVSSLAAPFQNGLEITDNGIGFDMSFATKIFEPFNRLHNNDEYKGNGIGLAICSKVCEKHHWSLSAESQPDVGSKFIISFNH